MSKRWENSVKSLVNLYTVVIGVALTRAAIGVVDAENGLKSVTLHTSLLFVAFVATLFPFVHGALRHLDDVYLENENPHVKTGAFVVDFVLLFIHALAFVVLALLIAKPTHFAWVLVVLLSVDVVWGLFVSFGPSSRKQKLTAEAKWTIINFTFVGIALFYLVGSGIGLQELDEPLAFAILAAFACVLRSVVDYLWCQDFYFPK